jgi:hypothetical protein
MTYLFSITAGMCISYFALHWVFATFFKSRLLPTQSPFSLMSLGIIVLLSLASYALAGWVSNPELSNRLLHMLGGGFLAMATCFLVVRDSQFIVSRTQFLLLSFLVVMALGVGNEIVEFVLQNYFYWKFAQTVNDTWLDLISNLLGALAGGVVFTPWVKAD